jgi:hypothetical protein
MIKTYYGDASICGCYVVAWPFGSDRWREITMWIEGLYKGEKYVVNRVWWNSGGGSENLRLLVAFWLLYVSIKSTNGYVILIY